MLSQYKGLRRENYILAFGRLVSGLGSMVWPMLTLILSQKMGVGPKQISWIISLSMVLMVPAIFAGGKAADRWNKKSIILFLDVVSAVCYIVCAAIRMSWMTICLMFLGSLCQNSSNPAYSALTADLSRTEDRERVFSLQYLCANLGLALAPTVAGLLFQNHLWLVFLINGVSISCSALLLFFLIQDTTPIQEETVLAVYQKERSGDSLWNVLKENRVIILYMIAVCGYYATYQMYVYLMPLDLAAAHGANGPVIYGSVTSLNCLVVVLITPIITRLFTRMSEPDKSVTAESLLLAGFIMFYIFLGHVPFYYISMTILTWGEIFQMTSESPYFTKRIPSSHRGRINGFFTVVRTAVASLYQLLLGAVYAGSGSRAAWLTVFGIGLCFVLLAVITRFRDRRDYPNLY